MLLNLSCSPKLYFQTQSDGVGDFECKRMRRSSCENAPLGVCFLMSEVPLYGAETRRDDRGAQVPLDSYGRDTPVFLSVRYPCILMGKAPL